MQTLGDRIKEYRTSIKMTQADFALRLGITGASVSAYENGTRLPSYEVLIKIADTLGVSTDELLGRKKIDKTLIDVTDLSPKERNIIQEIVNLFANRESSSEQEPRTSISANSNYKINVKKLNRK